MPRARPQPKAVSRYLPTMLISETNMANDPFTCCGVSPEKPQSGFPDTLPDMTREPSGGGRRRDGDDLHRARRSMNGPVKKRRLRFLCVHQGAELYGSDRSFLQAVEAMRNGWPDAHIRVVLAVDGPLRQRLEQYADEVVTRNLCILRLANPLTTALKATAALPYYVWAAWRDIARADLVYTNTSVVADYMLASRFAPRKSVIHTREIPKPKAMPVIRALCRLPGANIIFNSHATKNAFRLPARQRQAVIHNGVDIVAGAAPPEPPGAFSAARPLRIAMLGRISDWKGQDLLIDALSRLLPAERECIRLRIVGSAYRDLVEPVAALEAKIAADGLDSLVTLEPFRDDPAEVYRWADICAVPSRLPEPFGRVAIEAMAHGRPVIAAAHGGLLEIVEEPESGWLFAPNDPDSLAVVIRHAIADPAQVRKRGEGALVRFGASFSSQGMSRALQRVLKQWAPALRDNA